MINIPFIESKILKPGWEYNIQTNYITEDYFKNSHELNLIMKILIQNLTITNAEIKEILELEPFHDVSGSSLSNNTNYIVIRILLSIDLNKPDQSELYERIKKIILNPNKILSPNEKFIKTITATAEKYSIEELEKAIEIFNKELEQKQKQKQVSITGGKKNKI